jgi:hypothetical protein
MSETNSPPDRAEADAEFSKLLGRAAYSGLYPEDFKRVDELLPHVSPELKQL